MRLFYTLLRRKRPATPTPPHQTPSQSSFGSSGTAISTTFLPAILSSAEAISKLAPIPWLAPAVASLGALVTLINQAQANQKALKQLQDRCISFLIVIQQQGDGSPTTEQQKLASGAKSTLDNVAARMEKWASKSRIKLFVEQAALMTAIQDSHMEINDGIAKLHLTAVLDTVAWQAEFKANKERDHQELIDYLANIGNSQSIISMTQQQQGVDIKTMMTMMQTLLSSAPEGNTEGIGKNLYHLQRSAEELLPDMHLRRGEVRRVGRHPVSGTESMDIWEGIYLNEEKVAMMMLRAVHATPRSLDRLQREVDIWRKLWAVDRGKHVQPLYGFYNDDGNFPYVVTSWPEHGTADKYVVSFPDIDHRALIRGIIAGVRVLHSMSILHGNLRGANIVIDASWKPLIANFGFSRIVDGDVDGDAGAPFSQTSGVVNSQRWLAPELLELNAQLTSATDIYSFGMTVLELMTHAVPWASVNTPFQVVRRVSEGETPPRPDDPAVVARGLDDHLWEILQRCWGPAGSRPHAANLVQMLE